MIDLRDHLRDLTGLAGYQSVRVYARWGDRLLGFIEVCNCNGPVSACRLRDGLAQGLAQQILATMPAGDLLKVPQEPIAQRLDPGAAVSVVVATLDRPDHLRNCLSDLYLQQTERDLEVIVVDNHPESGLIGPVTRDFPGVVVIEESRRGLSYARNAGILASTGEIIVMTDDDVRMPSGWLEKLLAPFAREDVAAVTGNVLPAELDTQAQQMFEMYGGLGRGTGYKEFDREWFREPRLAVPTWHLGGTANAAFRTWIFHDDRIGLLEESLGAGMPAGVGEDTYLFYRILKSGHTLVYQGDAYVWHHHRREMKGLGRQLGAYSRGHVAYHLTTLLRDGDRRAIRDLTIRLPYYYAWCLREFIRRRRSYPLRLMLIELWGTLGGPLAFWRSRRRVRRQGASRPAISHPYPEDQSACMD